MIILLAREGGSSELSRNRLKAELQALPEAADDGTPRCPDNAPRLEFRVHAVRRSIDSFASGDGNAKAGSGRSRPSSARSA